MLSSPSFKKIGPYINEKKLVQYELVVNKLPVKIQFHLNTHIEYLVTTPH